MWKLTMTWALCLTASAVPAQIGWQQDADMGRTLANGLMWCDTSVVPNEVYAFGGSEHTVDVSVYHQTPSGWRWEDSGYDAPKVDTKQYIGILQEWVGGRAEYLPSIGQAICISGTLFQFGGLLGKPYRSVWSFDRLVGWQRMDELGDAPPDDRDFTTCRVGDTIYRFGVYSGPIATASNDMWTLRVTGPTEVTWTRYPASGRNPPPPLAHASLTYAGGLIVLSGGMRYELGAPISHATWITFPFPIGGKQLWIKILDSSSGPKWKGVQWSQAGGICRFGSISRFDRKTFGHLEVMIPGSTGWWRVPTSYARPEARWMNSGVYMPSENCFLMAGGIEVPGRNGGVYLFHDSWRFRL